MAPLHVAAQKGRYGLVDKEYLLVEGADINIKDNDGVSELLYCY